jgi:hypothetical protein
MFIQMQGLAACIIMEAYITLPPMLKNNNNNCSLLFDKPLSVISLHLYGKHEMQDSPLS